MADQDTIVAQVHDDSPCPLTGRVVAWIDDDRTEVAWGDQQDAVEPRTSVEWFDELRPVARATAGSPGEEV